MMKEYYSIYDTVYVMFSACACLSVLNPIAVRTAKTLWSFGCSECNRVK